MLSETISFVDGSWKIVENGRATAVHGRDAQREADRIAATLLDGRDTDLLVVIGLGLGFLLDALERRGWMGRVLALEPEPQTVAPMMARRDWLAWTAADRLRILTAPDFAGAADCWRWLGDASAEPLLFVHPVMERLRPEPVAMARATLRRIRFDAVGNAEARRMHGGRYLLNTLRNLPAIAAEPSVARLAQAAQHRTAVVVAAGPSLDAALPALRDVQHSALIVAVDTALRPLLRAGVVPHVVVAVDPSEANGRHLTDLPACPDTYLVAEASLEPFAIKAFRGRTFLFSVSDHQPWPWLESVGRPAARLRAWGSVLTTAFDLALTMGCDPVAFVGADLAYTGGRPYCRSVTFEEDWQRLSHWGEPVPQQFQEAIDRYEAVFETDVRGGQARTAPHLLTFRNWLVEQIGKETGRRFVNATGGGILRGGTIEQAAPDDLLALLPPPDANLRRLVHDRYRPDPVKDVASAVRSLVEDIEANGPEARAVVSEWERFAPGITREAIRDTLGVAVQSFADDAAGDIAPAVQGHVTPPADQPVVHADLRFEAVWLQQLASAMPLVPLRLPPERLHAAPNGTRVFRFRTTAARIVCCALRPPDGAVAEDGEPLTCVADLVLVVPGSYVVYRDEVYFRSGDDSDPRRNGREYTLLVPPPVAYLETLPFHEIRANDI